jgi:hypothetical protein
VKINFLNIFIFIGRDHALSLHHSSSHALVVGGTGMLKDVSLELVKRGYIVSVIARNEKGLRGLERSANSLSGRINPISLDYHDLTTLRHSLEAATLQYGSIQLAVIWIHRTAEHSLYEIAQFLNNPMGSCEFYHVLGSRAADPNNPDQKRKQTFHQLENFSYHEVILGFMIEDGRSRWLTHQEISQGVITALDRKESQWIVGTVRPWSARPV